MVDMSGAAWRKSSRSSGNGQCVEVAYVGDRTAARDSKQPAGSVLVFASGTWRRFISRLGEHEVRS